MERVALRTYSKNDLNAPRVRQEVYSVEGEEFWKSFKKKYPEYKSLSNKELKNKIKLVHQYMGEEIINNRDGIEFPKRLGLLFIGTCQRSKRHNTDHYTSKEYGKDIAHRNLESDSYTAKIFYTNFLEKFVFKWHELWGFTATRWLKRRVAKTYPEKWPIYIKVDPLKKITGLFKSRDYDLRKKNPDLQWKWVKKLEESQHNQDKNIQ